LKTTKIQVFMAYNKSKRDYIFAFGQENKQVISWSLFVQFSFN
jgi:hypothetical protein